MADGAAGATGGQAGGSGAAGAVADSGDDGAATGGSRGVGGLPSPRRPFLVGSSLRTADPSERGDWMSGSLPHPVDLDPETAAALASAWERDALEEHASVAAFARLTLSMLAVGAPPDMIAGSQRASLDEIEHARHCFALARRYGKNDIGPAALATADAVREMSLEDLAAQTFEEGCFGETLGALLACEQLACATDPAVIAILERIAADEARHAELAWRFVKWIVDVGGPTVVARIRESLRTAVAGIDAMVMHDHLVDSDRWHANGRLSCREARAVSRRGIREIIFPCTNALCTTTGTPSIWTILQCG
jgi:hypothetical protein